MIVKGEIGHKVLLKAEIVAIQVSKNYRDNTIRTEYTLSLHETDSLNNTLFKVTSDNVIFEETIEELIGGTTNE